MDRLNGKVILISGGARGQGAAEARLFVTDGTRVVLGDVLEAEGDRLAAELGKAAVFVRQDVTKEADWERAVHAAEVVDLAPRGIRVNSVHPGPIDTEMLKVRTPGQNEQRLQLVPMRRMGTADEVASLVLFLLSDGGAYITGAEIAIDGGATL